MSYIGRDPKKMPTQIPLWRGSFNWSSNKLG
jgi:hypothetical protein